MRVTNKKTITLLVVAGCVLFAYWLWLLIRPIEIVAVHNDGSHSSVLVKAFPLTNNGKIDWWLKNKELLKDKYGIPVSDSNGSFTMVFWYFGDGYKEEGKYDRRCFDDMKTKVNCIEKEKAFTVTNSPNLGITFTVHDGVYQLQKNGDIIKIE